MIQCQSQSYVSRLCTVEGSFVPEKSAYLHGQEGSYRAQVFDYELEKSALVPHGGYTAAAASPLRGGIETRALETHGVGL